MCCRLYMVGISEAEQARYQTGELKLILSIIVDLKDATWADKLKVLQVSKFLKKHEVLPQYYPWRSHNGKAVCVVFSV